MSLLGIKVKLGFFPSTNKIEKQHDTLTQDYQDFIAYSQSEELERFEYLNKFLNSPEFEEKENNPNTDREEIEGLKKEFAGLQKSAQLIKYFKDKANEGKFAAIKAWNLEFEDQFAENKLDTNNWLTRYYWGDKLLNESYSLMGDQHYITDGKNISVSGSVLSIETRNEKANGLTWNPLMGFVSRDFSYTSGIINTGKSFRHKYGKVEAKVKIPKGNAYHAFWLAGEKMLPQINIFKYVNGKFYLGNYWGDIADPNGISNDITALPGAFTGKSFIFSLEWTSSHLIWSINGVTFKVAQRGIPSEPMYIAFGSGMSNESRPLTQPVKLEVDWVRFYSKA